MMRNRDRGLPCAVFLLTAGISAAAGEGEAILIADFEGKDYGEWKASGEAFGPGPVRGTLPGQMEVSGFEGKGLVNSYHGLDKTTGMLLSPPFAIQRDYINFLIGGGWHPGKACINLIVDGKVVRTATGPNRKPGGTERLDPYSWEVRDLRGKKARIEIVDKATGGWGHINIDHIVQSNGRTGPVSTVRPVRIEHDYICFRIGPRQGPRTSIDLLVDDKVVRSYSGENRDKACWISWDVSRLKGQAGRLKIEELPTANGTCILHDSVGQSDEPKGTLFVTDKLYQETYRPQFHFTAKKNWLNDPNGLVYYKAAGACHRTRRVGHHFLGVSGCRSEQHGRLSDGRRESAGGFLHVGRQFRTEQAALYPEHCLQQRSGTDLEKVREESRDQAYQGAKPRSESHLARAVEEMGDGALPGQARIRSAVLVEPQAVDAHGQSRDAWCPRMSRHFRAAGGRRSQEHEMGVLGRQRKLRHRDV
jgi:hypothetical protein